MRHPGRLVSIVALGAALLTASCAGPQSGATEPGTHRLKIVIAETAVVDVFDQNVEGFKEQLAKAGYGDKEVDFVLKNAQGNLASMSLLAQQIVDEKPDLVYAVGTPLVIALSKKTTSIPVVFGLMTDPVGSGVANSAEKPGKNLTGTSTFLDPALFLDTFKVLKPGASHLAIMGNTGEQNTAAYFEVFAKAAQAAGVDLRQVPVSATGEILPAVRSMAGKVDALVLPTDNTVYSALDTVLNNALEEKIPVIAATGDAVGKGAVVGLGLDWKAGGALAADQSISIIKGTAPGSIPVAYLARSKPGLVVTSSSDAATKLGITLPADLATTVGATK